MASFGFIYLHELKGRLNQFILLEYTYIAQVFYVHIIKVLVFHVLTNFAATDLPLLQANL
jgi:hypothetical protein